MPEVREVIARYLKWIAEVKNPSPHTVRAYAGDVNQWGQHVGERNGLASLPSNCVVSFVQSQRGAGLSERTIVRRVAAIRGFHRWLIDRGLVEKGAWEIDGIQVSRRRTLPRLASSDDLDRLYRDLKKRALDTDDLLCSVRDHPHATTTLLAVSLMLATGLRVSETAAITAADIDFTTGSIRVLGKAVGTELYSCPTHGYRIC